VKFFIQDAAQHDLLSQVEWYAQKGLLDIARRFGMAAVATIHALIDMPQAGAPKASANPQLAGLRTWPVKGFDEFRIYYLVRPGLLTIVRIFHRKRDADTILDWQGADEPNLQ
jgi:plasmid stabilization system protein ParE